MLNLCVPSIRKLLSDVLIDNKDNAELPANIQDLVKQLITHVSIDTEDMTLVKEFILTRHSHSYNEQIVMLDNLLQKIQALTSDRVYALGDAIVALKQVRNTLEIK